jgi:hypothetical protein
MAKVKAYAPIQKNLDERLAAINKGSELWLAIEGRYTNLRIWKSRIHAKVNPDNTEGIYMRLDKANNYSVPLNSETVNHIENKKSVVYQLAKFEFPTSVDNLNEILEITKNLVIRRDIVAW